MRRFLLLAIIMCVDGNYVGNGTFDVVPSLRTDYKFRLIDSNSISSGLAGSAVYWPSLYQIDIRVNPCVNSTLTGGRGALCCSGTGEVNCQDSVEPIHAGPDLQIAYIQNAHISNCLETEFSDDPNCGTYIEIHRAITSPLLSNLSSFETEALSDVALDNSAGGSFATTYISTSSGKMCAGDYELWWVVRTRSGPYVQLRKPFSIITPSCVT